MPPPAFTTSLRQKALAEGAQSLCSNQELCQELPHRCAICGQHVESSMRISQHVLRCHPQVYKMMTPTWMHLQFRLKGFNKPGQCTVCAANVSKMSQHKCPGLAQIACIYACAQHEVEQEAPQTRHVATSKVRQEDGQGEEHSAAGHAEASCAESDVKASESRAGTKRKDTTTRHTASGKAHATKATGKAPQVLRPSATCPLDPCTGTWPSMEERQRPSSGLWKQTQAC